MKGQYLLIVVGHIGSGKTTLAKEIVKNFPINRVSNDDVRELLISKVAYFSDACNSYVSEKASMMNKIALACNVELVKQLLLNGQSVVIDGGGITKEKRERGLKMSKLVDGIKTIIIELNTREELLLERLRERDKSNKKYRWVEFYNNIRKHQYEPVTIDEADFVLKLDQNNKEEIIVKLKEILI